MPVSSPPPERSRSRALIVVLGLTVVAAAVVAREFLSGSGSSAGAGARRDAAASSPAGAAARRSDDDVRTRSLDDATRRIDLPAAIVENGPKSLPNLDWRPGPPNGFSVRVIDARTRKPIPGAHVAVVPAEPFDLRAQFDDLAPRVAADAPGFLADSHGWVRVAWPPIHSFVLGQAGELRGMRQLAATDREEFDLALSGRRDLRVEVVDRRGAPLSGARVTWAVREADGQVRTSDLSRFADDRGQAILDQEAGEQWHGSLADMAREALGVAVLWVGSQEAAAFTPVGDDAPNPLRCVVSVDFGAIAVRVFDRLGGRVDEEARLFCNRMEPILPDGNEDGGVFFVHRLPSFEFRVPTISHGSLTPVALGNEYEIHALLPDGGTSAEVSGPRQPDETVRAELRLQTASVRLHGRLVGVANPTSVVATIGAQLERPWLVGSPSSPHVIPYEVGHRFLAVHVVADGTFEIDPIQLDSAVKVPLAFLGLDGAHGSPFVGEVPLPAHLSSTDVDVGDVAVHPVPLIVSGRVRSPDHTPLASADVSVEGAILSVRTDASGSFLFVGSAGTRRRQLRVSAGGFTPATVEIEDGTRDLDVVLERNGAIVGRLLSERGLVLLARPHGLGPIVPEEEAGSRGFGFGVSPINPTLEIGPSGELSVDVARPFRFELRPGRYDVIVSLGGLKPEEDLIAKVPDVEVSAGATNCDPRLDPLDLQGAIGRWHITLARSDGAQPPSTWVRFAATDRGDDFLHTLYVNDASSGIESALTSAWVDFAYPGFRHIHELHERGDVKLVLEPVESHPFVVHVAAPTGARAAELEWRVRAEPSWTLPVEGLDWFTATADQDGDACLDLDEGESWRIHLFATVQRDDRVQRFEIAHLVRSIDDHDLAHGSVDLRPDVNDVEAALAALEPTH